MITDGILFVLKGFVNILLAPLNVVNIAVDFLSGIPIFAEFLQVAAYILPWDNLLPLIFIVGLLCSFRITIAVVKTFWNLIGMG